MKEVGALTEALEGALAGLEPPPFQSRVTGAVGERPLLPGALTVRVARRVDTTADIQSAAARGAGVQMCYEGLERTRSVLQTEPWEDPDDTDSYYQDLLVAEVLVSQGFNLLAKTGVVTDVVAIVQRFGRTQTALEGLGHRHDEEPLEVDVLELAVNAGVDLVSDVSPSIRAHSGDIARELLDYPLPDPAGLAAVDKQLDALAADARVTGTN